jgi:hypothetical protein
MSLFDALMPKMRKGMLPGMNMAMGGNALPIQSMQQMGAGQEMYTPQQGPAQPGGFGNALMQNGNDQGYAALLRRLGINQ